MGGHRPGACRPLSLLIKHTIVALPLALALWLCIYDRRAGMRFILTGLACAVIGIAACRASFGPDFIAGLQAPRDTGFSAAYRFMLPALSALQIPLAVGLLGAWFGGRDRSRSFSRCT